MPPGKFITFEGGDGAGKTTQQQLLAADLAAAGIDAVSTREPGGSAAADAIRTLLLSDGIDAWDNLAEALLHWAARRTHLVDVIWPALRAGRWVISDRFADSTLAYQGYGQGVEFDALNALHRIAAGAFHADLTIILDLPPQVGLARAQARAGVNTRYERMDADFHARVRKGFLEIARGAPERCVVVDADAASEEVHRGIRKIVADRLQVALP